MYELTEAQKTWLAANPEYEMIDPYRPGVTFKDFGVLYADGTFIQGPTKEIVYKPGCHRAGVRIEVRSENTEY